VARSSVKAFRQLDRCTPGQLRAATVGYRLHDLPDYWLSLPPIFQAVVVYLKDEQWLDDAIVPQSRSYGESWVVLDRDDLVDSWLHTVPLHLRQDNRAKSPARSRRISASLRFAVLRRDDFRCGYCGRRAPDVILHVDHRIPWSLGGLTTLDNLTTACQDCNLGKGARHVAESPTTYQTSAGSRWESDRGWSVS
jgi:hypothetical protein